jgi:hypothetical protein
MYLESSKGITFTKTPLNSKPSHHTFDSTLGNKGLPIAYELIPVTLELIVIAPPS